MANKASKLMDDAKDIGADIKLTEKDMIITLPLSALGEAKEVAFEELPEAVQAQVIAHKKKLIKARKQ